MVGQLSNRTLRRLHHRALPEPFPSFLSFSFCLSCFLPFVVCFALSGPASLPALQPGPGVPRSTVLPAPRPRANLRNPSLRQVSANAANNASQGHISERGMDSFLSTPRPRQRGHECRGQGGCHRTSFFHFVRFATRKRVARMGRCVRAAKRTKWSGPPFTAVERLVLCREFSGGGDRTCSQIDHDGSLLAWGEFSVYYSNP